MENELEKTKHSVIKTDNTTSKSHSTTLTIGMVLDDKYEIRREIARGGMGIVYEAYHKIFERKVAIKMILSDKINASQLKRFKKEIKACANLSHPNIIHIYNVGIYENNPYIVMEYIDGVNICEYVAQHDKNYGQKVYDTELGIQRDWKLCAKLIYETTLALEYIHKQKMLHRNINPSNILVRSDGTPIIIDLGLVKFQTENYASLTQARELLGTLQYMPIEQAQGKHNKIDARSDIYSLGLVLYELLTGEVAYSGKNLVEICSKIMSYNPPLPKEINPQIPEALEEITIHATEKQKEKRYATAQEFAEALKKYLHDENAQPPSKNEDALQKYLYDKNAQQTKKTNDYKKQIQLQWNKKYIIPCLIVLALVLMTISSMIKSHSISCLKIEIENIQEEYTRRDKNLVALKRDRYNSKGQLQKSEQTIEENKNQLSDYRKECTRVQEHINNVNQIIKSKQKELTSVTEEFKNIKTEKNNLSQNITQSQSIIDYLSKEIDSRKEERQKLEKPRYTGYYPPKKIDIIDEIKKLENHISNNENEIKNKNKLKEESEDEMNRNQAEYQTLNAEIKSIQDKIKVVQDKIDDKDHQIYEIDNQIEDKKNEMNSITEDNPEDQNNNSWKIKLIGDAIEVLEASKQPIINSKIDQENERNKLQQEEEIRQNELKKVYNKIDALNSNKDRISHEIEKLYRENQITERKKLELEKIKQKLETIEQELKSLNIQKKNEKERKKDLNNQFDEVSNKLSNKAKEKISLEQEIQNDVDEAQEYQNKLSELLNQEKEYNLLEHNTTKEESFTQKKQNTLDELEQKIKKEETEVQQLKDKLEELKQLLKYYQ